MPWWTHWAPVGANRGFDGRDAALVADDVPSVVLTGSGHRAAEQAPDQLLAALTGF